MTFRARDQLPDVPAGHNQFLTALMVLSKRRVKARQITTLDFNQHNWITSKQQTKVVFYTMKIAIFKSWKTIAEIKEKTLTQCGLGLSQ